MENINENAPRAGGAVEGATRTPLNSKDNITRLAESPQEKNLLINVMGLAAILGISTATCWRLDRTGRIPAAMKLGRSKRWNRKELQLWIEAGMPNRNSWLAMRGVA